MKTLISIGEEKKDFRGWSVYEIKALSCISEYAIMVLVRDVFSNKFEDHSASVLRNLNQKSKYFIWEVCFIPKNDDEKKCL